MIDNLAQQKMNVPLLDLKAQYAKIKEELEEAIKRVFDHQQLILGPEVGELESEIASYCKVKYAVGCASGSDALLLALMALGIGSGDAVITSPYSFFATAGSIARLGAIPVFIDIDPDTYNIDPNQVDDYLSGKSHYYSQGPFPSPSQVKAIIPVHLFGQCADMDAIMEIAARYQVPVIEDAAQAIGAEIRSQRAGSIGAIGCFSFYPSKNLGGAGDGGIITTNDEKLAERVRILRVHGGERKYFHSLIGCNSRLDTLQAAILRVKMKYLDSWTEARRRNALRYFQLFNEADSRYARLPIEMEGYRHVYNQFVIRVDNRDQLKAYLKERGIGTEVYYPLPLHLQECFNYLMYKEGALPESERASKETLAIPVYPELTEEMQQYVVDSILSF